MLALQELQITDPSSNYRFPDLIEIEIEIGFVFKWNPPTNEFQLRITLHWPTHEALFRPSIRRLFQLFFFSWNTKKKQVLFQTRTQSRSWNRRSNRILYDWPSSFVLVDGNFWIVGSNRCSSSGFLFFSVCARSPSPIRASSNSAGCPTNCRTWPSASASPAGASLPSFFFRFFVWFGLVFDPVSAKRSPRSVTLATAGLPLELGSRTRNDLCHSFVFVTSFFFWMFDAGTT